jgi:Tfp pilus assembly protein PilV
VIREKLERLSGREGVSLVEILIGVVILAVALLGLAAAGGVAARQVYMGRVDMGRWAAMQEQLESLVALGYDSVATGTSNVQGYPMTWEVTGTNPKQVTLVMQRENFQRQTVYDTLVTYLADPNPSSGS